MKKTFKTTLRALEMHPPLVPYGTKGGESHRRWLITVMLIMSYDTESKSRNADFISIARKGNPQPSGPKGPSNLRTLGPERAHPS